MGRGKKVRIKFKLIEHLTIVISLLALAVSFYSVAITKDSEEFQMKQVLASKQTELLLLMQEVSRLRFDEFMTLVDIQQALSAWEKLPDVDENTLERIVQSREYHDKRLTRNTEETDKEFKLQMNLIYEEDLNFLEDIELLQDLIGRYKLSIQSATHHATRDKESLKKIEKEINANKTEHEVSEDNEVTSQ